LKTPNISMLFRRWLYFALLPGYLGANRCASPVSFSLLRDGEPAKVASCDRAMAAHSIGGSKMRLAGVVVVLTAVLFPWGSSLAEAAAPALPREAKLSNREAALEALRQLKTQIELTDKGLVHALKLVVPRDEELALVRYFPEVDLVEIVGGRVSGAGLVHLEPLRQLQKLYLSRVGLTDADLASLRGLTNLIVLSMPDNRLTGQGLAYVKGLRNLEVLNLSRNPITDDALVHLSTLANLNTLSLEGTQVTGAGLAYLRPLAKLRVLNLNRCNIGDQDLAYLRGHSNLRMLYLHGCNVTGAKVERFRRGMPGLAAYYD